MDLWEQMANLTLEKCKECLIPYSCCSPEYCEIAIEEAESAGITLEIGSRKNQRGEVLPLLGENGCVCPPRFRPLCTIHTCSINNIGFDPKDPEWTEEYFNLRSKIDESVSTD